MATNKAGYGIVGINRKSMLSHRASWIIANGPIPEGMDVLHKCDNRKCGNPAHLFLGTDIDNMRDRDSKGRNNQPCGDKNGSRTMPWRRATGDRHMSRTKPESLKRGDEHYMRLKPELKEKFKGDNHWSRKNPEKIVRGSAQGQAKLTEASVLVIRTLFKSGETLTGLGKKYGVTKQTISAVVYRKSWTHI